MTKSAEEPSKAFVWSWQDYLDTKTEAEAEPAVRVTQCPPARPPRSLSARPKATRPAAFSRG